MPVCDPEEPVCIAMSHVEAHETLAALNDSQEDTPPREDLRRGYISTELPVRGPWLHGQLTGAQLLDAVDVRAVAGSGAS